MGDKFEVPQGWTVQVKHRRNGSKYKYYINSVEGCVCRSRLEVLRYLHTQEAGNSEGKKMFINNVDSEYQKLSGVQTINTVEGLPPGWTKEFRPRKTRERRVDSVVEIINPVEGLPPGWTKEIRARKTGHGRDAYYIDPVNGHIFRSWKEVFRYIETGEIGNRRRKNKYLKNVDSGDQQLSVVETVNTVEGLPLGWIKEIRARKTGYGRDTYYIDPVEGYVFRSKIEVLRYLQTGKVGNKTRKEKGFNDVESEAQKVSGLNAVQKQEALGNTTRKCFLTGRSLNSSENYEGQVLELSVTEKQQSLSGHVLDKCNVARGDSHGLAQLQLDTKKMSSVCVDVDGRQILTPVKDKEVDLLCRLSRRLAGLESEPTAAEHKRKYESEKAANDVKADSSVTLAHGDSWVDPCIEFAFKTLTGAIPLPSEDNHAVQDYIHRQVSSFSSTKKKMGLESFPEMGKKKFCKFHDPFQFNVLEKSAASEKSAILLPSVTCDTKPTSG